MLSEIAGLLDALKATVPPGEAEFFQHRVELVTKQTLMCYEVIIADPPTFARVADSCERGALRWMQSTYAGVDALVRHSTYREYTVTRLAGVFGQAMGEYVLMHILALERQLQRDRALQDAQTWGTAGAIGSGISERYRVMPDIVVGVLGFGDIGVRVAEMCAAVGARVWACRRRHGTGLHGGAVWEPSQDALPPYVARGFGVGDGFREFLEGCDYVVNLLPSTPETRGLLSAARLRRCKDGAVLINVGRGDVFGSKDGEKEIMEALDAPGGIATRRTGRLRAGRTTPEGLLPLETSESDNHAAQRREEFPGGRRARFRRQSRTLPRRKTASARTRLEQGVLRKPRGGGTRRARNRAERVGDGGVNSLEPERVVRGAARGCKAHHSCCTFLGGEFSAVLVPLGKMRIKCGVAPRVCGSFSPPPGSFPAIVLEAIFHAALISAVGRALSLPLALPSQCLLPPRLPIAIPRLPLAIRPASVARPASLAIAISAAIARVAAPAIGFASADARARPPHAAAHPREARAVYHARGNRVDDREGDHLWAGRLWVGRLWAGRLWAGRLREGRHPEGRLWAGRLWAGRLPEDRLWAEDRLSAGLCRPGGPRAGSTRATGWDSCARSVRAGRT